MRKWTMFPGWCLLWAVPVLVSCAGGGEDGAPVLRYDSLEMRVVRPAVPWDTLLPALSVASEPSLRIGVLEGDPAYTFSRIVALEALEGGGIVTLESRPVRVREFGADGGFVRTLSRAGEGPGELRSMPTMGIREGGRRLVLVDLLTTKTFDLVGTDAVATRSFALERLQAVLSRANPNSVAGPVADGRLLARQSLPPMERTPGRHRVLDVYALFDPTGRGSRVLDTIPGREIAVVEVDGQPLNLAPPFARGSFHAVSEDGARVLVGETGGGVVRIFDVSGGPATVLHSGLQAVPTGESDGRAFEEHTRERWSGMMSPEGLEQALDALDLPPTRPKIRTAFFDGEGRVWFEPYRAADAAARRYAVVDTTGEYLGMVRLPDGFDPKAFTSHRVFGVERGQLDVETVVAYELRPR